MSGEGLAKTRKTSEIYEFVKTAKQNHATFKDEEWVRVGDVQKQLQETIQKISSESDQNTSWLRDNNPKSERRISVLHARIESYQYCLKLLNKVFGGV